MTLIATATFLPGGKVDLAFPDGEVAHCDNLRQARELLDCLEQQHGRIIDFNEPLGHVSAFPADRSPTIGRSEGAVLAVQLPRHC